MSEFKCVDEIQFIFLKFEEKFWSFLV